MNFEDKCKETLALVSQKETKLGDLRIIAKEIKKDHQLALYLWSTLELHPQLLAILIMDPKLLSQEVIDQLVADLKNHSSENKNQLIDWLMANQLTKNKKTIALIQTWEKATSPLLRRIFWYYQGRLRWMGKTDQTNTEELLVSIEKNLANESPEVQWAMNFTAGQIGKWEEKHRKCCINIGLKTGLYKDEIVHKGCTPNYLPNFIAVEVDKLKK